MSASGISYSRSTRVLERYDIFFCTPRRLSQSRSKLPTNSAGVMMIASITGSSRSSMCCCDGSLLGLWISIVSPRVVVTRYDTPGAVVIRLRSNSRSNRSCTISMCSRPRNPQRNPKPNALELSGS